MHPQPWHATAPQDVSGGRPVEVQGTDGRVYGMEIDLELVGGC